MMYRSLIIMALVSSTSSFAPPNDDVAESPTKNDVVEQVSAGNAAALESIESYYCNLFYTVPQKGSARRPVAEYWRTTKTVRIRDKRFPAITTDVRIEGGRSLTINTVLDQPEDPNSININIDEGRRFCQETDAWQLSLFDLPAMLDSDPALPIYSLSELISKGSIKEADWAQLDGNKVAHLSIELRDECRGYQVWVDPKFNWLVVKVIHTLMDKEGEELWNIEHNIDEMRELKPSLFLPISTSISFRMKGKPVKELIVEFDGIRLNAPLPTLPAMPFPSGGAEVLDRIEGATYRINGAGQRSSDLFRIGATSPGLASPPPRQVLSNSYQVWGWVLGITALALLLLGLARRFIRRREV